MLTKCSVNLKLNKQIDISKLKFINEKIIAIIATVTPGMSSVPRR